MPKRKRAERTSVDWPSVPINPDNWSEASKRSMIYTFHKENVGIKKIYEDIPYTCLKCQQPALFSAEAQREAFEVRKAYFCQQRALCEECFLVRIRLEGEIKEFQRRWKEERRVIERDRPALMHWLHLLEKLPLYGASTNGDQMRMLKKRLGIAV